MDIYNRWGEKVFTTNDLENSWNPFDDPKGIYFAEAVYYYIISYTDFNGLEQNLKGHVVLLR